MAAKPFTPEPPPPPLALTMSRAEAAQKIQVQIEKGRQIGGRKIHSDGELTQARQERDRWESYLNLAVHEF